MARHSISRLSFLSFFSRAIFKSPLHLDETKNNSGGIQFFPPWTNHDKRGLGYPKIEKNQENELKNMVLLAVFINIYIYINIIYIYQILYTYLYIYISNHVPLIPIISSLIPRLCWSSSPIFSLCWLVRLAGLAPEQGWDWIDVCPHRVPMAIVLGGGNQVQKKITLW